MFMVSGAGGSPTWQMKPFMLIPFDKTPAMKMKGFLKGHTSSPGTIPIVYSAELKNTTAFGKSAYTTALPNSKEI